MLSILAQLYCAAYYREGKYRFRECNILCLCVNLVRLFLNHVLNEMCCTKLIQNDNSGVKSQGVFLLCLCRNEMAENPLIRAHSHQSKAEAIKIKEQVKYIKE